MNPSKRSPSGEYKLFLGPILRRLITRLGPKEQGKVRQSTGSPLRNTYVPGPGSDGFCPPMMSTGSFEPQSRLVSFPIWVRRFLHRQPDHSSHQTRIQLTGGCCPSVASAVETWAWTPDEHEREGGPSFLPVSRPAHRLPRQAFLRASAARSRDIDNTPQPRVSTLAPFYTRTHGVPKPQFRPAFVCRDTKIRSSAPRPRICASKLQTLHRGVHTSLQAGVHVLAHHLDHFQVISPQRPHLAPAVSRNTRQPSGPDGETPALAAAGLVGSTRPLVSRQTCSVAAPKAGSWYLRTTPDGISFPSHGMLRRRVLGRITTCGIECICVSLRGMT